MRRPIRSAILSLFVILASFGAVTHASAASYECVCQTPSDGGTNCEAALKPHRTGYKIDSPTPPMPSKACQDKCLEKLTEDQICAVGWEEATPVNTTPTSGPIHQRTQGSVVTLPLPLSNISLPGVVGRVINALMGIIGAIALMMFIWGGLQWMLAAGNTDQVAKAKKTIVWATLGLVAIFSSYAVLNFVINALRAS